MNTDDPLHSQNKNINVKVTNEGRMGSYFRSDTVFSLSHRILTETEIKFLEKDWDYANIQNKINEPELRRDFSEFCRRMRNKRYFRNEQWKAMCSLADDQNLVIKKRTRDLAW